MQGEVLMSFKEHSDAPHNSRDVGRKSGGKLGLKDWVMLVGG
jgi:hypothetical protein